MAFGSVVHDRLACVHRGGQNLLSADRSPGVLVATDNSSNPAEPTPLHRSAMLEFEFGNQQHKAVCVAADVREAPLNTGEMVAWLHCKAFQVQGEYPAANEIRTTYNLMIPAHYITRLEALHPISVSQVAKAIDVGVFSAGFPTPPASIGIDAVRQRVAELKTPMGGGT